MSILRRKNKLTLKIIAFILITFISSFAILSDKAKSDDLKVPVLNITTTQSTITAGVNEEFEVTYHVEPQPIPMDRISPQTEKEIVLVIDTSGSMSKALDSTNSRIAALKTAAKNFVNKFAGNDKVYLGIVNYDSYSSIITKTTAYPDGFINAASSNVQTLKNLIDTKLDAEGGTNIGEGIRRGLSLLNNNSNRKKYIIVMSDGEPTGLTYTGKAGYWESFFGYKYYAIAERTYDSSKNIFWWTSNFQENTSYWNYYMNLTDNSQKYGVISSDDIDPGLFLKYSNLMAAKIKQAQYTSYFIGFSNESNANKLSQISTNAGGLYYDAKDAGAIDQVYSQIADQIRADYMVEKVNFNFNVPADLTYTGSMLNTSINGTTYTRQLPNIVYTLNRDKKVYEADAFDVTITLKASKSGKYSLNTGGWNVTYETVNGTIVNELAPNVEIVVSSLNTTFNLSRTIVNSTNNSINLNSQFQVEYNVTPNPVRTTAAVKAKEVVLVVDTSGSMAQDLNGELNKPAAEQKLSLVKEMAGKFVDTLKGNANVKVGLVTFNKGAVVTDFSATTTKQYLTPASNAAGIKSKINAITLSSSANEGSNIGEGIRKALWLLSQNTNTKKHIVVISDGTADYYTSEKANANNFYTTLDNETDSGTKIAYNLGSQPSADGIIKAEQYSKLMAQTIKNNPSQIISSYFISLGRNGDTNLLTNLSTLASGNLKDCTGNDKNILGNNLVDIADLVRSEFIISNSTIKETLNEGLQFDNSNGSAVINIPKLVYVYNSTLGQYEAEVFKANLILRGVKLGNYTLVDDAIFRYKDIEGNDISRKFSSLSLQIKDNYVLRQGLFANMPSDNSTIGESYLDTTSKDIADNFIAKAAAYLKTSGEQTTIKISLNKDLNSSVTNIDLQSVKLYKVDKNNTLVDITNIDKDSVKWTKTGQNYYEIIIKVPSGDTSSYNHYIVNYNFKTVGSISEGYQIRCSAVISETGQENNLMLKVVGLPDLF